VLIYKHIPTRAKHGTGYGEADNVTGCSTRIHYHQHQLQITSVNSQSHNFFEVFSKVILTFMFLKTWMPFGLLQKNQTSIQYKTKMCNSFCCKTAYLVPDHSNIYKQLPLYFMPSNINILTFLEKAWCRTIFCIVMMGWDYVSVELGH
jgi:hypothetical protein